MPHGVRSASAQVGDDEVDPWVQRIEASGCAPQHYALQDCQGAHTHTHTYMKRPGQGQLLPPPPAARQPALDRHNSHLIVTTTAASHPLASDVLMSVLPSPPSLSELFTSIATLNLMTTSHSAASVHASLPPPSPTECTCLPTHQVKRATGGSASTFW
jgi:hypothetical protein